MGLFSLLNFFSSGERLPRDSKPAKKKGRTKRSRGPKPEPDDNYYDNFVDGRGY